MAEDKSLLVSLLCSSPQMELSRRNAVTIVNIKPFVTIRLLPSN